MSKINSTTPTQHSQPEISPIPPIEEKIVTRKIGDIILDPKINTRDVDKEIVVEYKDAIEGYGASWQDRWNELPRITESGHLWSGFHTLSAARLVFRDNGEIRCVIEGENERDAYFLATRTNAQHGRRRTNEEKRIAVDRWLEDEEMNQWTDGYIAKMCHVTSAFVGKRRLETIYSQPTRRKFINGAGEIEWMHTSRIGSAPTARPKPAPTEIKEAELEDHSGFLGLEQESVLCNFYRNSSGDEVLQRYRDFLERNPTDSHKLAGYRLLRGEAYRRNFFDEIDEIDESCRDESEPEAEPTPAEEPDEKSPRSLAMEEVEESYSQIEDEIAHLSEEEQFTVRQFLKVNYDAYGTYGWRERLKLEALERLGETLDQIRRDIKEKGLEAFGLSDPPEPDSPTPLQIEPVSEADTDETEAKSFKDLDGMEMMDVRYAASYVKRLFRIEGLPGEIRALSKQLHQALAGYAPDYSAEQEGTGER